MIHITPVDVYNTDVLFLIGISREEFDVFYEDNKERISEEDYKQICKDIEDEAHVFGFTTETDNDNRVIVFLRERAMKEIKYVVHECYHACNRILMRRGINHDLDDEPFAYLLGYLTSDLSDAYWKDKEEQEVVEQ